MVQGLGIALVAAQKAGVPVMLVDASQKALDKGMAFAGKHNNVHNKQTMLMLPRRKASRQGCY